MWDAELIELLAGIAEHLESQQRKLAQLHLATAALLESMKESNPNFGTAYVKHYQAAGKGQIAQLDAAATQGIGRLVAELKRRKAN